MKWVICALHKHRTHTVCSPWTYKTLLHTLCSWFQDNLLPCLCIKPYTPMAEKVHYAHSMHIEIYHISCCSLSSVVGCRSRQSPWCVQRSDDELNAVCLCPGRDHHINIALIQHSVCCMLITATVFLTLSLSLSYTLLLWDMWDRRVREDRLLKANWI